jgi:hypothetical protein
MMPKTARMMASIVQGSEKSERDLQSTRTATEDTKLLIFRTVSEGRVPE